jgi:hypothetical protein
MRKLVYLLTDLGAAHFWTGQGFVPVTEALAYADMPVYVSSKKEAQRLVRRLATSYSYFLKIVACRRLPARGAKAALAKIAAISDRPSHEQVTTYAVPAGMQAVTAEA